jgi:hypothetical protein
MKGNEQVVGYLKKRKNQSTFEAFLIGLASAFVAFWVSVTLFHLGITTLWIRYFLSVTASYLVLLVLVMVWVKSIFKKIRQMILDSDLTEKEIAKNSSSISILDAIDFFDLDLIKYIFLLLLSCSVLIIVALSLPDVLIEVAASEAIFYFVFKKAEELETVPILSLILKKTFLMYILFAIAAIGMGLMINAATPTAKGLLDLLRRGQ